MNTKTTYCFTAVYMSAEFSGRTTMMSVGGVFLFFMKQALPISRSLCAGFLYQPIEFPQHIFQLTS